MYLTKINKDTGMIDITNTQDGVLAIQDFKTLIDDKKLGIEAFTCVALVMDYLSPIRHYTYRERHKRAMRVVTGDSNAFLWSNEKIQMALETYKMLQYNQDREELEEVRNWRKKKFDEFQRETDDNLKMQLLKDVQALKKNEKTLLDGFDQAEFEENAPTRGDYSLTRLETLMLNKKSFYHERKKTQKA